MTPRFASLPDPVRRAAAIAVGFAAIALVLRGALFDPFDNDGIGQMSIASWQMAAHPWFPFVDDLPENDTGHPMVVPWIVALLWRAGLPLAASAHAVVWICGAIALAATNGLARRIAGAALGEGVGRLAGPVAALALLCHPLFVGMTAQYVNAIPTLAFGAAAALAALEGRRRAAFAWATLLALTQITGVAAVAGLGAAEAAIALARLRSPAPSGADARAHMRAIVRDALVRIAPFAAAAGVLALYLFVKLFALDRPLTTMPANATTRFDPTIVPAELLRIAQWTFAIPRAGMEIWAGAAVCGALAGVARARRAGRAPFDLDPASDAVRGYALLFGLAAGNTLVYALNSMTDLPRYFLLSYPLAIVAGLHGTIVAFGRPSRWLPLVALWCGAQAARWDDARLGPLESRFPRLAARLRVGNPEWNLGFRRRIAAFETLVADVRSRFGEDAFVLGVYPTVLPFARESAGYVETPHPAAATGRFASDAEAFAFFDSIRASRTGPIVHVLGSWDVEAEAIGAMIERSGRFERVAAHEFPGAGRAEIFVMIR